MTQNLALGDTTKTYELTNENSDLASGQTFTMPTAQTSGSTGWPCSSDSACKTARVYATNNDSYGNYYIWYTATANTGTYSMSSGDASGSICPKGWRLPTGGSSGEFMTLMTKYGWDGLLIDLDIFTGLPLSFVFSGFYDYGVYNQGVNGDWWSSTVNSSSNAYGLGSGSIGSVSLDYGYGKYYGFSVRCVAAP